MNHSLALYLLGKFQVEQNGQPLTSLTSAKGQALLAYLATIRQPRSRSALAGLLWGEAEEKTARANLRTTLSKLQKVVPEGLIVTRQTIAFDPRQSWLDVAVLEQAATSGQGLIEAAALYRGELLEDLPVSEALGFEEWLLVERERYRQLALSVLTQLTEQTLATGQWAEGITAARRLLELEPWHEAGHRQLMRLFNADGQRNAALVQFEHCWQLLTEELGVEPSRGTADPWGRDRQAGPLSGARPRPYDGGSRNDMAKKKAAKSASFMS